MIKLDLSKLRISSIDDLLNKYTFKLAGIRQSFFSKSCPGSDFLDWLDWPTKEFYETDYRTMHRVHNRWLNLGVDTVIVIGIGGSSIGANGVIDMCTQKFNKEAMDVIFVSGLHTTYNVSLLNELKNRNWALVVISKSGTTFETAVNFRIYREKLLSIYGNEHNERIVVITDKKSGKLKPIAINHGYDSLCIPNGIGGRYSTITPVGLFPMMLAGIDIDAVLRGWKEEINKFKNDELSKIEPMIYAAARYDLLTEKNKAVEVFCTYENNLTSMSEHYKQIFAESEGKIEKCLIPTIANNSEDLHSIGQLYQDGPHNFFETTLMFKSVRGQVLVPKSSFGDDDELDKIVDRNLLQLNYWIQTAVKIAHKDVPNITIKLDEADAYHAGLFLAWIALAAATSARLINVNPFNQPGVEDYKNEMKKLIK